MTRHPIRTELTAALAALCLLLLSGPSSARDLFNTGDRLFDSHLAQLNATALADTHEFMVRMNMHFGVPVPELERLIVHTGLPPADVYIAVRIGRMIHKPVGYVIERYQRHGDRGWGALAKELGIRPGSREFHALKKDEFGFFENAERHRHREKEAHGERHHGNGKAKGKGKKW